MIKLKGKILVITGKDEKLIKKYARKAKMSPDEFVIEILKKMAEKYVVFEKDLKIERVK